MDYKLITDYTEFKVDYVYLVKNNKIGKFNERPICVTSLRHNTFIAKNIGDVSNSWSANLTTFMRKYGYSFYEISHITDFKRYFPEYFFNKCLILI